MIRVIGILILIFVHETMSLQPAFIESAYHKSGQYIRLKKIDVDKIPADAFLKYRNITVGFHEYRIMVILLSLILIRHREQTIELSQITQ